MCDMDGHAALASGMRDSERIRTFEQRCVQQRRVLSVGRIAIFERHDS